MTDYVDSLGSNKDIDSFRTTFYKSDEMIKAFNDVGIEYRNRMWDNDYEEFKRKTKRNEKDTIKYIGNLKKIIIPAAAGTTKGDESYIVYDLYEKANDALGNELVSYRSNLGCYHVPKVKRQIKVNDDGDKIPVVVGIDELLTKYSIPFCKDSISKLEKYVTAGSTSFTVQRMDGNRRKITVDNFEDWKNVESEYLLRFGHKPSDYEKQILADEKQGKYQHFAPPVNPGPQYH
jgi:hypothetical protein